MSAVKRRKQGPRVVPKKVRRTWLINPRTRVHTQEGYRRARAKAAERRRIAEELDRRDEG